MPVVVLQHVAVEGPGRIGAALDRAERSWRVIRLFEAEPVPVGPSGLDGLVIMGGPMGVGDTEQFPHLLAEQRLIADCLDAGVPVLGVCLGAQLVAKTLGSEVTPGPALELGWLPVTLTEQSADDVVVGGLPQVFDALHWHGDVFTLPPGATHLASSERTALQAFRHGANAYGLLFHLEADQQQVAAMARAFPADVERAQVDPGQLTDPARSTAVAPLADGVFDAWCRLLL